MLRTIPPSPANVIVDVLSLTNNRVSPIANVGYRISYVRVFVSVFVVKTVFPRDDGSTLKMQTYSALN